MYNTEGFVILSFKSVVVVYFGLLIVVFSSFFRDGCGVFTKVAQIRYTLITYGTDPKLTLTK